MVEYVIPWCRRRNRRWRSFQRRRRQGQECQRDQRRSEWWRRGSIDRCRWRWRGRRGTIAFWTRRWILWRSHGFRWWERCHRHRQRRMKRRKCLRIGESSVAVGDCFRLPLWGRAEVAYPLVCWEREYAFECVVVTG